MSQLNICTNLECEEEMMAQLPELKVNVPVPPPPPEPSKLKPEKKQQTVEFENRFMGGHCIRPTASTAELRALENVTLFDDSDSGDVLEKTPVTFYCSNVSVLTRVLNDFPDFATGRRILWKERKDQSHIDATYVEKRGEDHVLVNLRKNASTGQWENLNDFSQQGSFIFTDQDALLLHATEWPIPPGLFRDYVLLMGRSKGLLRIYG